MIIDVSNLDNEWLHSKFLPFNYYLGIDDAVCADKTKLSWPEFCCRVFGSINDKLIPLFVEDSFRF